MASAKVEQEIDDWVGSSIVHGHNLSEKPLVVADDAYYDELWKQALKDHRQDQFLDKFGI